MGPLTRAFLASAPFGVDPDRARPLEDVLAGALRRARAAWPGVALAPEVFVRHLAERLPAEGGLAGLEAVRVEDLYLACAVASGDRTALVAFEEHVLSKVAAPLARSGLPPEQSREVQQRLRERLLVAAPGRPPRIAGFTGRGSLAGWVRMAAARVAIDLRAHEKPHEHHARDGGLAAIAGAGDLEIEYLKRRYGDDLREAFHAALGALPAREAAVLRLHFLEGMSARSIGVAHRVHERTVQKWLAAARAQVLDETRRLLRERLHLEGRELESVIALVQSQLALNVSTFLRREDVER